MDQFLDSLEISSCTRRQLDPTHPVAVTKFEKGMGINQGEAGEGGEGWKWKKSKRTHSFQLRFASPFANCFKKPEHSPLQWFGRILPGYILEVGQKVWACRLDIVKLDERSE
jgi:hypothetical protein